jgi:hypothetical protein
MKNSWCIAICTLIITATFAVPFVCAYTRARDYPVAVSRSMAQKLGLPGIVRLNKKTRVVAIGDLTTSHRLYAKNGQVWDDQIIGGPPRMGCIRIEVNKPCSLQLALAYRQLFPQ